MKLIKNAEIYGPEKIKEKNILICGKIIYKITDEIPDLGYEEIYDCKGKIIIPGLIDQHIHITGGGGEGGFKTKVPEIQLSKLIEAGITTVVGLLGTDAETRSVENLVAKSLALTEEGIDCYSLTGSYDYPSKTITGSVKKDIIFIEKLIGVKVAANDHRDSAIRTEELAKLGAEARLAGMISGKSGHVTIHLGSGKFLLNPIREAVQISNLPISTFRPTHINRTREIFEDAVKFAKEGGYVDATSRMSKDPTDLEIYERFKEEKLLDRLTFSTDGFGSYSKYDKEGNLLEIGYSAVDTSIKTIKDLVEAGNKLEEVIKVFTTNVSRLLKIDKEVSYLKKDYKANLLVLNEDLSLNSVLSQGRFLMKEGKILVKGTYE